MCELDKRLDMYKIGALVLLAILIVSLLFVSKSVKLFTDSFEKANYTIVDKIVDGKPTVAIEGNIFHIDRCNGL